MIDRTSDYIKAFHKKELQLVTDFFCEDAVLFDPANTKGVRGKENISKLISDIFKEYNKIGFFSKNIFYDQDINTTIIEFELKLDSKRLVGVDIIRWKGSLIKELRAYLY